MPITQTTLVSADAAGDEGNRASTTPSLSADGRYALFLSYADDLVPGVSGSTFYAYPYLRDLTAGTITAINLGATTNNQPALILDARLSANAGAVAVTTNGRFGAGDVNDAYDIYVQDRATGRLIHASTTADGNQALGPNEARGAGSQRPDLSADGRFVAFDSVARGLAPGDTRTPLTYDIPVDVFVKDLATGAITRASTGTDGALGTGGPSVRSSDASLSADGRFVAFESTATNFITDGPDTNGAASDIFVKDLATGVLRLVSRGSGGGTANGRSLTPEISDDGRFVVFVSEASDLVAGDTNGRADVFVADLATGALVRANTSAQGAEASPADRAFNDLLNPAISADGRYVAFSDPAANLVAGDTNGVADIFVKDLVTGDIQRVSLTRGGDEASGAVRGSLEPALSGDGGTVAFRSDAANLVADDTNGAADVFATPNPLAERNFVGGPASEEFVGGAGRDLIAGGAGDDRLFGRGGDDTIGGQDGNDLVAGEDGDDRLYGDAGDDVVGGGAGADLVVGGAGHDRLYGDAGDDTIGGQDGDDLIVGGTGNDRLYGDAGDDVIGGQDGDDLVAGQAGNDRLYGDAGNDTIGGGDGDDLVAGQDGDDLLYGDAGNDTMGGGAGADRLEGQGGDDLLWGDAGSDHFVFRPGFGRDTIVDFEDGPEGNGAAGQDVIVVLDFPGARYADIEARAAQVGADVVISFDDHTSLTLRQTSLGTLGADDFLFG